MAILRKLGKGERVLMVLNDYAGVHWVIKKDSSLVYIILLAECEFYGEEAPLEFVKQSRFYDPSKPCYTFLKGEATYQVNISIED